MTLDKAIEILGLPLNARPPIESPDFDDALTLGIEALKRLKTYRSDSFRYGEQPLSSETKE